MAAVAVEKRSLGALGRMGIVAGMHVAVVLLVANSLGLVPKTLDAEPMITEVIDEPRPIDEPPPRIDDRFLEKNQIVVPTPDELPPITDDPPDRIFAKVVPPPPDQIDDNPREESRAVTLLGVRRDPAHPLTRPPYPAPMIRGNYEGVVEVEVFVQPDGRVADARIVKSSGFDAFDRATLDEARRRWRLLPASRDGVPYAQWVRQRVVFNLEDR